MKSVKFGGKDVCPSKIVCIGRNYAAHIQELDNETPTEPVIFIKPNSSLSDEIYFNAENSIHYEGELTFLIRSGKLHGVGFGLDLTKRELQSTLKSKGLPWERSKSFDNSAVFSEFITLPDDISNLSIELHINERLVQRGNHELMLYKPTEILNEISGFLSLEDNDLIMTGTPEGVGAVQQGDVFTGRILANDTIIVEQSWTVKSP